jgi:hypothetical protein
MLYQPRDIGFVFQNKNGLAQPVCLSPAAGWIEECSGRSESLTE